jgi:DNA replication licensing factor MCM6
MQAGIQATLNARTSVLAAANPMGGRYDRAKPLRYNVALPPAILSRFDLLHVMVDEPDPHLDAAIANHILSVHTGAGAALNPPYGTEAMQCYIRYARAVRPGLPPAAQRALVAAYKRLRGDDAAPGTATAYRITVRQLEALVRLSEALARLHLREEVSRADVREAFRLVKNSIVHVDAPDAELADEDAYDGFAPGAAAAADIVGAEPGGDEGGEEGGAGGTCGGEGTGGAAAAAGDGGYGDARPTGGAAAAAGAAAGAAAAPPRRAVTKVPQAKYNDVKALLALRLRQLELGEGGAPAPGERRELGSASEVVGCAQRDLLRWYFEHLVARGAVASREAGVAEIVLAEKIVAHLVRREQVLLVVDQPERRAGEGSPEFARRCQNERVLALNPNFSVE